MFTLAVGATPAAAIDLSWMAAALLAAAGLLAMVPRRGLPRGLPEGVFSTAVTVTVLHFGGMQSADTGGGLPRTPLVLATLSAIWYLAVCALESVAWWRAGREGTEPQPSSVSVGFQAAIVCGLLAAAGVLDQAPGSAWPVLLILLLVVLSGWVLRRGWPEALASIVLLTWFAVSSLGWPRHEGLAWLALLLGTLALLLVLWLVVLDWYVRSRAWRAHPYGAPLSPWRTVGYGAALTLSAAGGLAALSAAASWVTVFSGALSAYAAFGTAHRTRWAAAGWLGLLLVVQAVAALAWVCLSVDWAGAVGGLVLPAAFLLWLALFWRQQLHNGQAWTTTGRLIVPAYRLAAVLTAGALVLLAAGYSVLEDARESGEQLVAGVRGSQVPDVTAHGPMSVVVILLLVTLAGLWLWAWRQTGDASAEFLACLAAASVGLAAGEFPVVFPASVQTPMVGLAAAGFLLALGVWLLPGRIAPGVTGVAFVGGVLPTLVLIDTCRHGVAPATVSALVTAALGTVVILLALRSAASPSLSRQGVV